MNRSVQSAIDQLLLEQGEYSPLEYLLQEGRLMYADYEAWRNGELSCLDEALFGDPGQICRELEDAEEYLQHRGWQAAPRQYHLWGGEASRGNSPPLKASSDRPFNERFHRCYCRPEDLPQLDLFTDSPVTSLANGIARALASRDAVEARRLLEQLADAAPDHAQFGAYEQLTEAAEAMATPVGDVRTELLRLQETLIPLADSVLGRDSHNLLIPLWRRLAEELRDRSYDADEPELHSSYTAAMARDWAGVRLAVENESEWRSDPVLLLRHARACDQLRDTPAALSGWFALCWQYPDRADALASSTNTELREQWHAFGDLEPALSIPAFPAWLLLTRPALTQILPEPAVGGDAWPESYPTVYHLCAAILAGRSGDDLDLRRRLKSQDPDLMTCFLATIARRGNGV